MPGGADILHRHQSVLNLLMMFTHGKSVLMRRKSAWDKDNRMRYYATTDTYLVRQCVNQKCSAICGGDRNLEKR